MMQPTRKTILSTVLRELRPQQALYADLFAVSVEIMALFACGESMSQPVNNAH